jgi:hypothetical protein
MLLNHHFIQTIRSLQHVSTFKGTFSGNKFDTFWKQVQQNESPDVIFNLVFRVYCIPHQQYDSQYKLSWILHLVTHFVELAARKYQIYSLKMAL